MKRKVDWAKVLIVILMVQNLIFGFLKVYGGK
jgi:hypothetical protein